MSAREYMPANQGYRQTNGPAVVPSRIKPPSDVSSMIGRRPYAFLRNGKLEEYGAISAGKALSSETLFNVQSSKSRDAQATLQPPQPALSRVNQAEMNSLPQKKSVTPPRSAQIQKKLFVHADEMSDSRHNPSVVVDRQDRSAVRIDRVATSKMLDESVSEDFTASTADPETPLSHSRGIGELQRTFNPPTTARPARIAAHGSLEGSYPAQQNYSKVQNTEKRSPLSTEKPGKPNSVMFALPLKVKQDFSSPIWDTQERLPYDKEAYDLLFEARNELHNLKESWKGAVLASNSISKIKQELSSAKASTKEVAELRQALLEACADKQNLTIELRKVAAQYDLLSQQFRDSDARCRQLEDSRAAVKEQKEAALREVEALRAAAPADPRHFDDTADNSSTGRRELEEKVEDLESQLATALAEREDLALECDDLRRFADTLQIAATDAEQVL